MPFSQLKISSILASTKSARRRLSFGAASGLPLFVKIVKPIKVAGSCPANQIRVDQWLIVETEPKMRTAHAAVLWKADAAVRNELTRFDLAYRGFDEPAVLPPLVF